MVSSADVSYIILGMMIVGTALGTYACIYLMDWCSGPGERLRAMELAARKDSSNATRLLIVETLFPTNKVCS